MQRGADACAGRRGVAAAFAEGPSPVAPAGLYAAGERRAALNAGGPVTPATWPGAVVESSGAAPGTALGGWLLALATGLGSLWFGYPFLTSHTAHVTLPGLGEVYFASAMLFDVGVFAVVVGATLLILTALAHQSVRGHRRAPEKTVTATTGPRDVD